MRSNDIYKASAFVAIAGSLAFAAGCGGSEKTVRASEPSSYRSQYSAEMEEERQEFIDDTRERLTEIDREIGQLQARIQHESEYVLEDERAGWKQDLFELQQEQSDAQARLERARTASPREWEASRGALSVQVDRLEAGLATLGSRISDVFSGDEEREPVRGEDIPESEPMPESEPEEAPEY
jgi:hypothetical protein